MAKKLYGTDPDQVPTNADLGTIAYQDAERPLLGQTTLKSAGTSLIVERTSDAPNLQLKGNGQNLGQIYAFQNGAGGNIAFYPANSVGTITQRMIINRDGNVTINNGNLVMGTSGTGIDFSATGDGSGTMTSELLDDYEEGTFTPTVTGSSTAGTTTYSSQAGYYTKIGRLVNINCIVNWSSMTGAGFMELKGIPYAIANLSPGSQNYPVGAALPSNINWTGGTMFVGLGLGGSSIIALYGSSDDGGATRQNCVNESANFRLTMSYMTT